jgi:hypothetical protein
MSPSQKPLPTHDNTTLKNERRIFMPRAGFKHAILAFLFTSYRHLALCLPTCLLPLGFACRSRLDIRSAPVRCTTVIQKVRFAIFYLNTITTYRVTHEAETQSHISFASPHSHQVCLDTYHNDISICQVLRRKKFVLVT